MCDNTASTHFSNVASTYAAIYHQLYYNMNEGQIPGAIGGNLNHHSHPHTHGHSHTNEHIVPPGPPGPYNHLQPPAAEPLNFQHHPVSFNNAINNPPVSVHPMDRPIQLPAKKQQTQMDTEGGKFYATLNESSHASTGSFDNEEPIPMFLNSPGAAMNMKRRPCEKEEQYREMMDPRLRPKDGIMVESVSALRNYEEWLGNKPADMSTKTMMPITMETEEPLSKKPKKSKKKKKEKPATPEKKKYIPAGQANVSKSKAHKYDRLNEIREKFYQSCHVCFNDQHINMSGCPLQTPVATVNNHDDHPFGFGLPEELLMGLSRVYKNQDNIFARDHIAAYTRFGPLKGKRVILHELNKIAMLDVDLKHFWPVNASENDELDIESFIDTRKTSESNWIRFLKPEYPTKETPNYNVQRVTLEEEIYFITTRDIQPGEELFFRAIEPPFRVYYNISHLSKASAVCQQYPCKKKKESATVDLENHVYYVRHAYLNHPCRPGVSKIAGIYNCNLCKEDYFDLMNYQNHMKEKHGDMKQPEPVVTCYFCKKLFSSKQVLRKHIKAEHPTSEPAAAAPPVIESMDCPICGKNFQDKYKLRWHMKTIHLSEPIPCRVCGKSFKSKPVMENHIKKVHEQKYWKECTLCGKGFKDMYQLRQHMLTHTGQKPFRCIIKDCPAQFTTKQWLQKHYVGGHGFTTENMPKIARVTPGGSAPPSSTGSGLTFKPKPKKKATYVPPAKPGTSLRIPADFNLQTALRPVGKPPVKNKVPPKDNSVTSNKSPPVMATTSISKDIPNLPKLEKITTASQPIEAEILPQVSLGVDTTILQ